MKIFQFGGKDIISYKLGTSLTDTAYTSCHVSYVDPDSKETIEHTYTPDIFSHALDFFSIRKADVYGIDVLFTVTFVGGPELNSYRNYVTQQEWR